MLIDGIRMVYAFKDSQIPIGGDLYYANASSVLSVMKTALYLVITILFDAFIVGFQAFSELSWHC